MTVEQVENTLPINDEGNVYMELFDCYISPEDFISRFEGAELTYDSLYNHPNSTTGWKIQFEEWYKKGII